MADDDDRDRKDREIIERLERIEKDVQVGIALDGQILTALQGNQKPEPTSFTFRQIA